MCLLTRLTGPQAPIGNLTILASHLFNDLLNKNNEYIYSDHPLVFFANRLLATGFIDDFSVSSNMAHIATI